MTRKLRFQLLALLALFALAASGCELDSEAADTDGGTNTPDTDMSTNTDTPNEVEEFLDYRFVRVQQIVADPGDSTNKGADLDAIVLQKAGGGVFYATEVLASDLTTSTDVNTSNILNQPDAFPNFPGSTSTCNIDDTFVSLGDNGGYIDVQMGGVIESGDTLTVLEVSNCDFGDGEAKGGETVRVSVSVSDNPTAVGATWVEVATGEGPAISATVPTLPNIKPVD